MNKSVLPIDSNLPCIPSNYSRLIARELGLQIRDLPSLLDKTLLTTEEFIQNDKLLTTYQQVQIIQNALKLSNDEALGLRMGRRLTPLTHGVMGLLVNSSPNLMIMLKAIQTFIPTRMHFASLDLKEINGWLECHVHFDLNVNDDVIRTLSEAFSMAFFECARFILGRPLEEAVIHFIHSEPNYTQNYAEYLPGKIEFSQSIVMVKFPMEISHISNVSASKKNYALAYKQCEFIFSQLYEQKETFKYQVQKLMLSHPSGMPSEEDIAAELFMSKRTLARKLKQEDTNFHDIRENILSQQAASYLSETNMSVEAIASFLNYHDSSNFRRAFKRWFNMTPDQYRS